MTKPRTRLKRSLLLWSLGLAFVAGCAIALLQHARQARHMVAVAAIERIGGTIEGRMGGTDLLDLLPMRMRSKMPNRWPFVKACYSVYLEGTPVKDDDLKYLRQIRDLTTLSLGNTAITDAGLIHMRRISTLRFLSLDGTGITDDGLAHLAGLQLGELWLHHTKVGDQGLVHLYDMKSLSHITLTDTRVTQLGIRKLIEAIPRVGVDHDFVLCPDKDPVPPENSNETESDKAK